MLTTLCYETAMMSMQRKRRFGHDLMPQSKAEFLQLSLKQLSAKQKRCKF